MTETSGREKALQSLLNAADYALSAIDSGRSEPLFIAKDSLRNALDDYRAALASPSTQEPSGTFATPNLVSEGGFQVRQDTPERALRVEEIARQVYDDMQEDNSHEQNIAIIAAALRTYAGESAAQLERAGLERAARFADEWNWHFPR